MSKAVRLLPFLMGLVMVMPSFAEDPSPSSGAPVAGTPPPAAAPAPSTPAKSALKAEIKIGTAVENHDVTGAAESFPSGTEELWGWTRITGAADPTQISHVWKKDGKDLATIPLAVKSASFRTYSHVTISGTGSYSLEVKDADGASIGSATVTVK